MSQKITKHTVQKLGVIVLNWNNLDLTQTSILSIKKCLLPPNYSLQIYLLDNHSSNDVASKLQEFSTKNGVIFMPLDQNFGYAEGNNIGIKQAKKDGCKQIILANNDIEVDKFCIQELLNLESANPNCGLIAPKIYFYPGKEYHASRYTKSEIGKVIWAVGGTIDWDNISGQNRGIDQVDTGQFDSVEPIDWATGCFILLTPAFLAKNIYFDPNYYLYLEDTDLCLQTKKHNLSILFCPTAKIWHINSGSSGASSELHNYFLTRNRLIFSQKWAPLKTKLLVIKNSLYLYFTTKSNWQKTAVQDYFIHKWGRGSWV